MIRLNEENQILWSVGVIHLKFINICRFNRYNSQADQGTEFFNKSVARMLKAFGPKLYYSYSLKKAAVVERVQRTLRARLGRLFTRNKNTVWINEIEDIVRSYNNTPHGSTLMKPSAIKEEHTALIFKRLFPKSVVKSPPKFLSGDKVRIVAFRRFKQKEYEQSWTSEIFTINTVVDTDPFTYTIKDQTGEIVLGNFYEEELQHVKILR